MAECSGVSPKSFTVFRVFLSFSCSIMKRHNFKWPLTPTHDCNGVNYSNRIIQMTKKGSKVKWCISIFISRFNIVYIFSQELKYFQIFFMSSQINWTKVFLTMSSQSRKEPCAGQIDKGCHCFSDLVSLIRKQQ